MTDGLEDDRSAYGRKAELGAMDPYAAKALEPVSASRAAPASPTAPRGWAHDIMTAHRPLRYRVLLT
jgi:hypothetical protein